MVLRRSAVCEARLEVSELRNANISACSGSRSSVSISKEDRLGESGLGKSGGRVG